MVMEPKGLDIYLKQGGDGKKEEKGEREIKVSTWRRHRDAACYSFLVSCTCRLPSRISELFIVYDLFLLPIIRSTSSISILACCGWNATASPCLCTRRSPKRLPDKCTLIHNTCDGGLYIDSLIPPRPRCNMNFMLHQFKCVMSPIRAGSSTYHIYDMLQHIAGPRKISEAEKRYDYGWTSVDFSLLIRRLVLRAPFLLGIISQSEIQLSWTVLAFSLEICHTHRGSKNMHSTAHFNNHNASNAHFSKNYSLF